MKILISYLSFLVLPLMCSKSESSNDYPVESMAFEEAAYEQMPQQKNADFIAEDKNEVSESSKIIKTANLRFATANIDESYALVQKSAQKYKAIIQNDNTGKDYHSVYRNVTLRIPKPYFDVFINDLSKGVAYFDRKEISAQDVSEEFIDLEARLKAKQSLEKRYLELLSKANKVSEILEIEKELANIREEIEAKQGRLQYLQSRVAMSTITIEMYTEKPQGIGTTVSYGSKMWNAIKSGFNGLSSFFLGILYVWPFILILAIVFFIVRRKLRNKKP
jgi:VIT1/CCC1 family predicted Fe2+/Mn2+ transporter